MPTVYLQGRCSKPTDLPDVCAKCGAETTHRVTKTFSWFPPWIGITILAGVLIYFILATVLRKDYTVAVPLCKDHKGHWTNRVLLSLGSFVLLVGLCVGLGFLRAATMPDTPETAAVLVLTCVGSFITWLVILIVAQSTAIRPKVITDHGIRLMHVCEAFVRAYEDQEDAEWEASRAERDRRDERRRDEHERPRRQRDRHVQTEEDY